MISSPPIFSSAAAARNIVDEDDEVNQDASSDSRDEVAEIEKLVRQETKVVRNWRWVVIIAMLLVAGVVTTATYIFLSSREQRDFEDYFNQYASSIVESSKSSASTIRHSCKDFTDIITTTALLENTGFPFVTIPNFLVHAQNLRRQTSSLGFFFFPKVENHLRNEWSKYVLSDSHLEWYSGPSFVPDIWYLNRSSSSPAVVYDHEDTGPFFPLWQVDPLPALDMPFLNFDVSSLENFAQGIKHIKSLGEGVVGDLLSRQYVDSIYPTDSLEPLSFYFQPIFDSFHKDARKFVGFLTILLRWNVYFSGILPDNVQGIQLVLENTCNSTATWAVEGKNARYVGTGDLHDQSFDVYKVSSDFNTYERSSAQASELGACIYTLHIYPSSVFETDFKSTIPLIATIAAGTTFMSMTVAFLAYDRFQRRRNVKIVATAARSNALVSSLFPSNIRDRLLQPVKKTKTLTSPMGKLYNFLEGGEDATCDDKPIADLFLETTIMFADITDFTAWSSTREPPQVFILLENVFSAIDQLAHQHRVFKVETVGDCYVAVTGLPQPRKDHAIAMAKFASDALWTVQDAVKRLEITLGPDTGDLGVRIGLHSGSVTGGVLRGDRARFQLFGDTINTASRIESTGLRNRIHTSNETAELLVAAGKGHWLTARKDVVSPKGKGLMQTYWLERKDAAMSSTASSQTHKNDTAVTVSADNKTKRLIDWQVDVLSRFLKKIAAHRNACNRVHSSEASSQASKLEWRSEPGKICLDELKDIIWLPEFDADTIRHHEDPDQVLLDKQVLGQLRTYIGSIALMYRNNHFHSFEHACHVTMSVTKFLSRIVAPSDIELHGEQQSGEKQKHGEMGENRTLESTLHDHTYGITSDPLTQFSLVFSALIHDVDHTGVPNTVLIEENKTLASEYRFKSVAEQNSVDLAWNLLQGDQLNDLRLCIYSTQSEFNRFRQLVVQAVLATDIADKELKVLRNSRWDIAFSDHQEEEDPMAAVNRKATIVIEHLIQASDVAHTMQHWHVYRKWNENFFFECYRAFQDGRIDDDPSLHWYQGELGFFDFYIIPLAKKLKRCGVFGVSSDESLNYALKNRQEWEDRGKDVVEMMIQRLMTSQANEQTLEIGSIAEA